MSDLHDINVPHATLKVLENTPVKDGEIVSTVQLQTDLFTQIVFAFDKGQGLGTHTNPNAVVVIVLDGSIDFTVGEETHAMSAGDTLYMNPKAEHSLVATSKAHMQLLLIKPDTR